MSPVPPSARVRATVAVCTHNRAALLEETLEGLSRMRVPAGGAEVLVVDNASTDDTAERVGRWPGRLPVPLRYVHEARVGLSAARNRAIAECRGEVLAFLDDDAVPAPDWLVRLLEVYDAYPDAHCVGGRVALNWRTPPPRWWRPDMDRHLSAVDFGPEVMRLAYPIYPYGANISFRRAAFENGLRFDPTLGRRGKVLAGGEEVAVCLAIERAGGGIYYTPHSRVGHLAERERASEAYLYRKSYQHGRSCARVERVHFGLEAGLRKAAEYATQGVVMALRRGRSVERGCEWRFRAGYVREALALAFRPDPHGHPGPAEGGG